MVAANAVLILSLFVASILGRLQGSPGLDEVVFCDFEGPVFQIDYLFGLQAEPPQHAGAYQRRVK